MCLAVIPDDKVRRDTNNSVSVEECIGLNTSGVCFSVVFWKSAWTHRPSFGLRTGRPTNGGCNPIRGTKSSSLKSANLLWGLLSVACKGHYGFFFQDSKRFDRAAGLIYPPSVVVLGMCGGKTEKNHEKPTQKPQYVQSALKYLKCHLYLFLGLGCSFLLTWTTMTSEDRGSTVVKVLCYKSECC